MLSVLEDPFLANRAAEGRYTVRELPPYSGAYPFWNVASSRDVI